MDTESRYANIEQELLAVMYGYKRFHTYLYGRSLVSSQNLTTNPWNLSS